MRADQRRHQCAVPVSPGAVAKFGDLIEQRLPQASTRSVPSRCRRHRHRGAARPEIGFHDRAVRGVGLPPNVYRLGNLPTPAYVFGFAAASLARRTVLG